MDIKRKKKLYAAVIAAMFTAACLMAGCGHAADSKDAMTQVNQETSAAETETAAAVSPTEPETLAGLTALSIDGALMPELDGLPVPPPEPEPEYLRNGLEHPKVAKLQARLMELGFMDNDEPTEYYGNVTQAAVKSFQRQNGLVMDGIVGPSTWDAIMTPDAKYYAVAKGVEGDDISRIQTRLYELGYLAEAELVTGHFGDTTEAAVIKLQEVNNLSTDGKVGQQTLNLLYSDEIKPNYLAYGEKSEVVLACQNRLKQLGYLTTTPDGAYGDDTTIAVKQFQSRNDLVVDGYLGPSTRIALNGSDALPNGLALGEQGAAVERVQQLLSKYGYLSSSNVTGYYGEVTEKAVKSFQSNNGLSADGSVGVMTMGKLTGDSVKKGPGSSSSKGGSGGKSGSSGGAGASALISVARSKLGCPYVYGAKGPNAFDCSGFVYWCLNQVGVRQSYLTSSGWRSVGKYTKITSFSNLKAGDIIVVSGHVGIVAGGGQVIDASSSNGRVIQRSLSSWWSRNFICGWRIFG